MSVTIALPPVMEQQLRDDAAVQGVSVEQYVSRLVLAGLSESESKKPEEMTENELYQKIQLRVQPKEMEEFYLLSEQLRANRISEESYEKLLILTNRIELAHAERMRYVLALAHKRNISLDAMMLELGLSKNER